MLFSSWQFLFLFLPITFFVYFWLNRKRLTFAGKAWLVLASLFFYAQWNSRYLPLILISILFNFAIGTGLAQGHRECRRQKNPRHHEINRQVVFDERKSWQTCCCSGYYKYTDFLLDNHQFRFRHRTFSLPQIVLPLAISFFTFTQIAYLVDSYRGETAEYDLLNYSLFVTFFPHLIAGPIVHHGISCPSSRHDGR